jgi:rSAM/selenodomain-associated transferase 2
MAFPVSAVESSEVGAVSIIIPTCEDAVELSRCLSELGGLGCEIIVVDCGADAETRRVAEIAGCQVVRSAHRHRARQMNLGATVASGTYFLFLHADTRLPAGWLEKVTNAMKDQRNVGGAFARKYQSPSVFLKSTCWLAKWRSRFFGWYLGDQTIFVRREVFEVLNGYQDFSVFEDLDFSRRLRASGRSLTLFPPVVSSARRFDDRGPFATTMADFYLTLRYLVGADPNSLGKKKHGLRGHDSGLLFRNINRLRKITG